MLNKRHRYSTVCLLIALLGSGGCGFHLRGELPASSAARNLAIIGIGPSNPLYGKLVSLLTSAGGSLAAKPGKAGATLNILVARHERRPITLSIGGKANSFDLTFRVVYRIVGPKGEEIVPEQDLIIRRDYFNQQISPLGQGDEEAMIRKEMETDAASTLLRRVVYSLDHQKTAASSS